MFVTIATRFCGRCGAESSALREQARADVNRIAAVRELDVQGAHGFPASRRRRRGRACGRRASSRELLLEPVSEAAQALIAGVDDEMRDLRDRAGRARRRAPSASRADSASAAAAGCGRDACAATGRGATRAGRRPCRAAASARRFSADEHRAAAGREHDVGALHELGKHLALACAKSGFALDLENHRDAHAGCALDLVIAVVERLAEAAREQLADGCLAGAHQTTRKILPPAPSCSARAVCADHAAILSESRAPELPDAPRTERKTADGSRRLH